MKLLFNCFVCLFISCLLFVSCKKESFITNSNASVNITRDSIKFDTVFTTAGSVTKSFKIINENDQKLLLSKVKLVGGGTSSFKININGNQAFEEDNIELAANDSIYVFVSVFIDPTAANLPFILNDRILISYNNNERFVELEAYGQNAHFLSNTVITNNTVWQNDLPYVILGSVQVDTAISLSIEAGCKIYSHADAPFLVDGTLLVNGTSSNRVTFAGDRLDEAYKDLPAGWPGIYFRNTSIDNEITFAIIKNANQAIVVNGPAANSNPKLAIHQCIIDNAFEAGLYGYNSSVNADNTLISNCGNNLIVQSGGNYTFTNCTVAAYSTTYFIHSNPVLQLSDAAAENGATITHALTADFVNCIFWGDYGSVDDEVVVNKEGSNPFSVTLQNCLYKAINDPLNTTLTSVINNQDPLFDSIDVSNKYYDFHISRDFAPGVNTGIIVAFSKDLDDSSRAVGLPDIGSYEKQP